MDELGFDADTAQQFHAEIMHLASSPISSSPLSPSGSHSGAAQRPTHSNAGAQFQEEQQQQQQRGSPMTRQDPSRYRSNQSDESHTSSSHAEDPFSLAALYPERYQGLPSFAPRSSSSTFDARGGGGGLPPLQQSASPRHRMDFPQPFGQQQGQGQPPHQGGLPPPQQLQRGPPSQQGLGQQHHQGLPQGRYGGPSGLASFNSAPVMERPPQYAAAAAYHQQARQGGNTSFGGGNLAAVEQQHGEDDDELDALLRSTVHNFGDGGDSAPPQLFDRGASRSYGQLPAAYHAAGHMPPPPRPYSGRPHHGQAPYAPSQMRKTYSADYSNMPPLPGGPHGPFGHQQPQNLPSLPFLAAAYLPMPAERAASYPLMPPFKHPFGPGMQSGGGGHDGSSSPGTTPRSRPPGFPPLPPSGSHLSPRVHSNPTTPRSAARSSPTVRPHASSTCSDDEGTDNTAPYGRRASMDMLDDLDHPLEGKRKGKGGRSPAMDPRLDPDVEPKKAKRILANRMSAARSKMKQKMMMEGLRAKHDLLKVHKESHQVELEQLRKMCNDLEKKNTALQAKVEDLEDYPPDEPSQPLLPPAHMMMMHHHAHGGGGGHGHHQQQHQYQHGHHQQQQQRHPSGGHAGGGGGPFASNSSNPSLGPDGSCFVAAGVSSGGPAAMNALSGAFSCDGGGW